MNNEAPPLTDLILLAFVCEADRRSDFGNSDACPYSVVLDVGLVSNFIYAGTTLPDRINADVLRFYRGAVFDSMRRMIKQRFLVKENGNPFQDGDTGCKVAPSVDLSAYVRSETSTFEPQGLSNDWLEASIDLQRLVFTEGGIGARFSTNAIIAALNYELISQCWKQRHVPDDPLHAFLETETYFDLCTRLDVASNPLSIFEPVIPSEFHPKENA